LAFGHDFGSAKKTEHKKSFFLQKEINGRTQIRFLLLFIKQFQFSKLIIITFVTETSFVHCKARVRYFSSQGKMQVLNVRF
jgi:hypothetical protein